MACTGGLVGFPTAEDARKCARDLSLIFEEICAIQQAILTAIDSKQFETLINDGTPMTTQADLNPVDGNPDSIEYYRVFADITDDRVLQDQMDFVIRYFSGLGYNIKLQVNPSTQDTLQWYILW